MTNRIRMERMKLKYEVEVGTLESSELIYEVAGRYIL